MVVICKIICSLTKSCFYFRYSAQFKKLVGVKSRLSIKYTDNNLLKLLEPLNPPTQMLAMDLEIKNGALMDK